jgi:hypothetical protein
MSRSLLAITIAAASVCGVWIHAATHDVSPSTSMQPLPSDVEPDAKPEVAARPSASSPVRAAITESKSRRQGGSTVARAAATPARGESESSTSLRQGSAMRVPADPATGEVPAGTPGRVLTIDEVQELARREAAGLATIRNADGSETLNHEGRFTDFSVVRAGPDGRPVFRCVHGELGIEHALEHHRTVITRSEDR